MYHTGFLCAAIQQDKKHRLANLSGIVGRVHAGMALGISEFNFSNYPERTVQPLQQDAELLDRYALILKLIM